MIASAVATAAFGSSFVLALSDRVSITLITTGFGFLSSFMAALFAYLNRREIRDHRTEARERMDEVERKVDAPRNISTTREEGVRIEGPDV